MNAYEDRRSAGRVLGEWVLWTAAFLTIGAVHAGAVAFLMRSPEVVVAEGGPPPAIMIELAPEPEAINTEETDLSTDEADAEEVKTASTEPIAEPLPEPVPEPESLPEPEPLPEPVPEVAEPVLEPPPIEPEPLPEPEEEIDPIEEMVMAQLENVEVPIPLTRPKPEPRKEPVKKVVKKEKPKPQQQASVAARKAKAEVQPSTRNAASAASNASGRSSVSPAKWQSRLASHLERRKRYPAEARRNREEGTVYVRFKIDDGGNVLAVSVTRSSGSSALDDAVLDMVRRASPVPAPPPGVNKTITTPVRFNIR
ncbi:energy transducer TonB [Peteryoungia ipomoeae]|uniref:Protein TonB n=1 Tax=Peteryoungia ipomoeae TaxID=1210932 RepID=A0A4S8NSB9_9HYPH|nr:energy transducer TonB [Peteryoungia ipomoeae]THV20270.1 energy transducer TonB [Peteryoungia ipomoeae]